MAQIYRFGDFTLDVAAHELRLRGERIRLDRRPFDLLVLLVTRAGLLVTREEIIRHLWPARVIIDFDTGLNTLVRKVRQALGDPSEVPVYIETVPGFGYRFVAPVSRADPSSRDAGQSGQTVVQMGRQLGVDFVVASSLRAEQSRIRVTSHVIRVADGVELWTASFDRELISILGLQRELSIAIAAQDMRHASEAGAERIESRHL